MVFEQIATGGCQSYLIGCGETAPRALIDPELGQVDRYLALTARGAAHPLHGRDPHARRSLLGHQELARQLELQVVMHR